jgi:hypothetical protein
VIFDPKPIFESLVASGLSNPNGQAPVQAVSFNKFSGLGQIGFYNPTDFCRIHLILLIWPGRNFATSPNF